MSLATKHLQEIFQIEAIPATPATYTSDTIDTAPLEGTAIFLAEMGLGFTGTTTFTIEDADDSGGPWDTVPNSVFPNLTFGSGVPGGGFAYSIFGPTPSDLLLDLERVRRYIRVVVNDTDANFVWSISILASKKVENERMSEVNQV